MSSTYYLKTQTHTHAHTGKQNQMETLSGNVFSSTKATHLANFFKEHIFGKYNANISWQKQCALNLLHVVGERGGWRAFVLEKINDVDLCYFILLPHWFIGCVLPLERECGYSLVAIWLEC